ncbi:hypothetical protein SAMN06295905_1584 [Devosia lucknowensis]|uniref:GIY-YIG domain-containing protein n=1 Tax=Devosia lucknowensis TaxID=1096929 RepID=A0A1Y6F0W8_9HYPH|nr:hypothetical protein [Devosia lucknowensis]SMQ68495.1 hypothetical protein SAMN06295905_1584 [Devosia lucknowensis]
MVKINVDWWEHLTPKPMHRRLREVERVLGQWCETPYGRHWLGSAMTEHGVIRVKPGQPIPVVQIIALGDRPMFVAPQMKVREGHRTIGPEHFGSGKALADGELAIEPSIQVDVVTDPAQLEAAERTAERIGAGQRPNSNPNIPGLKVPSLLFSAPAKMLLIPKTWVKKSYVLYQHIFGNGASYPIDGFFYVGVTTRSWQKRWSEHRRQIETGSPLLFHRKFREEMDAGRITYVHHKVMGITDDVEVLYDTEEYLVKGHWHDDRRLNMIPGGKSGLKYLREHGLLAPRVVPSPDERDVLLEKWLRENPRRGLPAPWVSERWKDDEWAVAQICGRDGRLSVEQVRAIRRLADEHPPDLIAERIGALNKEQVQRVIDGQTYTRVN